MEVEFWIKFHDSGANRIRKVQLQSVSVFKNVRELRVGDVVIFFVVFVMKVELWSSFSEVGRESECNLQKFSRVEGQSQAHFFWAFRCCSGASSELGWFFADCRCLVFSLDTERGIKELTPLSPSLKISPVKNSALAMWLSCLRVFLLCLKRPRHLAGWTCGVFL